MTRSILWAGSALALVLSATTALAGGQPAAGGVPDILVDPAYASLGESLGGDLTDGDSRTNDDGLMDRYVLDLQAGTRVEIIMRSDAFDTYLIAGFLGADGYEQIALDDDGLGEELNSRLRFIAAETGRYEIRARGFAAMGAGAYTLAFGEQAATAPGQAPGSLIVGSETQAALTDDDARYEWDETFRVDDYVFNARAGDRVQAIVRSSEFDTTAAISSTSRWGAVQQLVFDDDGLGEGTNSRARFVAPEDGEYTLRVSSFAADSTGAYSVGLSLLEPWPEPTAIEFGVPVSGAISEADALGDDDRRFDAYAFDAAAGQRLEIIGDSVEFPIRVSLGRTDGTSALETVAFDNNYTDALGATRVLYTVETSGRYEVWVGATSAEPRGGYTLSLNDRGPLPPPPPPGSVSVGDSLNGSLNADDGVTADEKSFDDYDIATSPGQRLSVTMRSDGFDTYLNIYRVGPDGGLTEVTSDDDGGGDLDSRATFEAAGGLYRIRATSYAMGALGDYSLTVRDLGPLMRPTPLRLGRTYRGALDSRDSLTDAEGHFDSYGFSLEEGDRAQFIARSDTFDAFLTIAQRVEGGHEFLLYDNDGLGDGSTDSRLTIEAPETGDYEVWVTTVGADEAGPYTLETHDLGPAPASVPLAMGSTISGRLEDGDGLAYEGTLYDGFTFQGMAGQRIRVDMASSDFDTFLLLGVHGADGLSAIGENDDVMGEGTNSSLAMVLPSDAQYEIWATSYALGETGAYSLTLTDLGPEPAPGSLLLGSTVRGELTAEDPIGASGGAYDAYQFDAVAGQEVRITLTSNVFDAYVELGRMQDGVFTVIAEDDDSLSDLNSLLVFTPEDSGPYVARARSYSPGESGAYVLSVE